MHDEFRLQVLVAEPRELLAALKTLGPDPDAGRVAVTHEQDHIFVYADSPAALAHARTVVEQTLAEKQAEAQISLWRWHPLEERWEDAGSPLPLSDAEKAIELERRTELRAQRADALGRLDWEVRMTLPTHDDARVLAARLEAEGISVSQHWRHLLVGAKTDDEALALAERLRSEAPAGSEIVPEASGAPFWKMLNPYAVFGGIAN